RRKASASAAAVGPSTAFLTAGRSIVTTRISPRFSYPTALMRNPPGKRSVARLAWYTARIAATLQRRTGVQRHVRPRERAPDSRAVRRLPRRGRGDYTRRDRRGRGVALPRTKRQARRLAPRSRSDLRLPDRGPGADRRELSPRPHRRRRE